MDPQVSTSFIPKKPLVEARSARGGSYGLIFLVSLLIFITSIVAAGGAFLYDRYLTLALDAKKASLAKYEQAYDLATIQTLVRYDSRINEARKILENHLAPSAIFTFLSEQTLEKVQFTDFSYVIDRAQKTVNIELSGTADSFATVALQSDQFGKSKSLRDIIFSGVTIENGGKITFIVNARVDPALILYSSVLAASENPPAQ